MNKAKAGDKVGEGGPSGGRFLRRQEVTAITGLPTSTLYEMMSTGNFPRPVRLSARLVAWVEVEVTAWQRQRIAARDAGKAVS